MLGSQRCIVFFEILQPVLRSLETPSTLSTLMPCLNLTRRPAQSEIPIAWAFLRLARGGGDEESATSALNVGDLRLQLYPYEDGMACVGTGDSSCTQPSEPSPCRAHVQWLRREAHRQGPSGARFGIPFLSKTSRTYNGTIYVSVRGLVPAGGAVAHQPSAGAAAQLASGPSTALLGRGVAPEGSGAAEGAEGYEDGALGHAQIPLPVRRPHELCKIPNALSQYLSDSARGTTFVAFANQGKYIAIASADASLHTVRIFDLHTSREVAALGVHHDTIYEVSWSHDDMHVVSASSDNTAQVWAPFANPAQGGGRAAGAAGDADAALAMAPPVAVLQHLSFVYTAKFHPVPVASDEGSLRELVVTGCFDHAIRVWDAATGHLLQTVNAHGSHVNALAFDASGKYMYSGDGRGILKEFICNAREAPEGGEADLGFRPRGFLKVIRTNRDLEGEPISCIRTMATKRKVVVLTKRSTLCAVDLSLFSVGRQLHGVKCLRTHIQFAISPDERYVISGSEDGRTFIWNIEDGQSALLQHICNAGNPITCVSWSPFEHVIAVSTFKPQHPIMIFVWDEDMDNVASFGDPERNLLATPRRRREQEAHGKARVLAELPNELTPDEVSNIIAGIKSRMAQSLQDEYERGEVG